MSGKLNDKGQYVGVVKTNIPGFEQFEGRAMVKDSDPDKKTILFSMSKNKSNLFKGTLHGSVKRGGGNLQYVAKMDMEAGPIKQKLSFELANLKEKEYNIGVTTDGNVVSNTSVFDHSKSFQKYVLGSQNSFSYLSVWLALIRNSLQRES